MARPTGFEPVTFRLEGECSNPLSYERLNLVREVGFKPTHIPPYKEGALFISATRGYNIII